jgi:hypothetical protein
MDEEPNAAETSAPYNYIVARRGPIIWIALPQQTSRNNGPARQQLQPQQQRQPRDPFQRSGRNSTTTRSTTVIRRMLVRPSAVLLFGFCLLQALYSQDLGDDSVLMDHKDIPCGEMGMVWGGGDANSEQVEAQVEEESQHASSLYMSNDILQEQMAAYPIGYGRQGGGVGGRTSSKRSSNSNSSSSAKTVALDLDASSEEDPDSITAANNPQLYGWEPKLYPDPLMDSVRCGVAYLQNAEYSNSNGTTGTPNAIVTTPSSQEEDNTSLRLCDPDWVLGGMYLEELALALHSFSRKFSSATIDDDHEKERKGSGVHANANHDDNSNSNSKSNDVNNYERVVAGRPTVQLAVATVRKVCKYSIQRGGRQRGFRNMLSYAACRFFKLYQRTNDTQCVFSLAFVFVMNMYNIIDECTSSLATGIVLYLRRRG